jgi:hypothetical protein
MGVKRRAYSVLVGNPEGYRVLRRPRRTGENNIKISRNMLRGFDWIDLTWDRDSWWAVVNVVTNI